MASTSGKDEATTSGVADADRMLSQLTLQSPPTKLMSVAPVPPQLTSSLSSPKASLTSLRSAHVAYGLKEQWLEWTLSENDFNLKREPNLTRTFNNTQLSIAETPSQEKTDDMFMKVAQTINTRNRMQRTDDLLMQTLDRPVPLVTAACVEEATAADGSRAAGDRLFVGTQSGELLQLLGRSAFSLKTELQPVVGLAVLPDGVLLALEATGRLSAFSVDRSAVLVTAEGPERPVRIAGEVCVSECLLPSGHQLVPSLSNMLAFTGLNTLLLPLKTLSSAPDPSAVPSLPSPDNSGAQSDAQSDTCTAAANDDVDNGSIVICELVRCGLFSFEFGRQRILDRCDSIACIAGHACSPLVAIGLTGQVNLISAESLEQLLFVIHPNLDIVKHWTPASVAIRTNALFVCATYGNEAVEEQLGSIQSMLSL